jgi:outer membrane biosynthesis protein TonB
MGATKFLTLENSLGQKVRTFAVQNEDFNLVYVTATRRVEAIVNLKELENEKIDYRLLETIQLKKLSQDGIAIRGLGRIRPLDQDSKSSPAHILPEENDEELLQKYLKKTSIAHIAAVILLITSSLLWNYFFNKKQDEQLVTIVMPKAEAPVEVRPTPAPHVKVSEHKIKPSNKVYRPKVAQHKLQTKPYKTRTAKAVDVQRVGALAALGGLPQGHRGSEGLDMNSVKNIRSAGTGSGGGGIGSAGRGGIKGYVPGTGLIAGSNGTGGQGVSAGGYGTKGVGGGKAGYGKIAIIGGTSAVSLPLDDEATVEGGLDRDQIIAVINRNRGQIVYCYERGLQAQPNIGGRVAVSFVINAGGRVSVANVAQSSLASKSVENCIVGRMKTWQFPKPVGRVNVDVLYPFELMRVSSNN